MQTVTDNTKAGGAKSPGERVVSSAASVFVSVLLNIVVISDILLTAAAVSYYFFLSPFVLNDALRIVIAVLFVGGYALTGALLGFVRAVTVLLERILAGAENIVHGVIGLITGGIIARSGRASDFSMTTGEFKAAFEAQIEALRSGGTTGGILFPIAFVGKFVTRIFLKAIRFVYMGEFAETVEKEGGMVTAYNLDRFAREKALTLVTDFVRAYTETIRYAVYAVIFILAAAPFVLAYFIGAF